MAQLTTSDSKLASLAIAGGTPVTEQNVGIVKVALTDAQIEAANKVMRTGMLAQGPNVKALEDAFGPATSARHAVACSNGTTALQLAYETLIEPGDEVLVPAWTYIATVSMVVARGARPVWVDVDPRTFCIDVEDARRKMTPNTTAIAATHLYGNVCDIKGIEALAIDHGLATVFDAAQAHMATYNGKGIGAYGDAVTYSFYPTKNMTTGEGGMVTTNDEETEAALRSLRSHGECAKYVHDRIGYNYRMSDLEGAIGVEQLKDMPAVTARRRAIAAAYDSTLANIEGAHAPLATDNAEHAYHLYAVRLELDKFVNPAADGQGLRDFIADALRAEGVGVAVHYPRSLTRQPVFEHADIDHQPVSDSLADTLFCIPVHHHLSDQEVASVQAALTKVLTALKA